MNKAEFVAEYGHRYAHCNIPQQHNEHEWTTPFSAPVPPQHPDEHWWCDGSTLYRSPLFADEVMEDYPEERPSICPTCESPDPAQHPATQPDGGEVNLCRDEWHNADARTFELRLKAAMSAKGWTEVGTVHDGEGTLYASVDPATKKAEVVRPKRYPDEQGWEVNKSAKKQTAENRALPVRWADRAMFKAEPMPEGGPRVYLLWMTPDPLGAIAAACKMYKGEVVRDLSAVTDEERIEYLEQVTRTKLKAPFEFVKFHFMIEGVTRSFTHQMVRQRTAVYAQESLRFAVKGDENTRIPVGLPPSLSGTEDPLDDPWGTEPRSAAQVMRDKWEDTVHLLDEAYGELIDLGMPAEDARGLLPHNTLTRLHYSTDLRALLDHAGNRLCTQAQFEWRLVFAKIAEAIRNAGGDRPMRWGETVYMGEKLADLFKPVCYQTGRCEFKANFDRACSIRNRVDANEDIGRPSSKWSEEYEEDGIQGIVSGCGPKSVVRDQQQRPVFIGAIKPGEWLLDPGAARKQ
jgi:flavin-dependent thymidylate synthase